MTTKGKIIAGSFVAVVVTGLILAATGMFAQSTPLTRAFDKCEAYHQETDGYSEELARDVCVDQSAIRDSDWFIKEWS